MKKNSTNKAIFALLLGLIVLSIFSGCAGLKKSPDGAKHVIGKEVLVTDKAVYQRPIWCAGGDQLVYMDDWSDIFSYNIRTGQKERIAERSILPILCTPTGEQLIYLDSSGAGWEDNTIEAGTLGLWSYQFSSNEHKQLAVVYADEITPFGENISSPDSKTLLLGMRPKRKVDPPEGAPEITWSSAKRTASSFLWLSDSSGLVKSFWNEELGRDVLKVSALTPDLKTITIDPHSHDILLRLIDDEDSIYMKVWDGKDVRAREVLRCALDLERQNTSCESVLKRDKEIIDFDLSPVDEAIVFTEAGGRCVKSLKQGEDKARCMTPPGDHTVHNFSVSPNGRLVAYISGDKLYYRPFDLTSSWSDSSGKYRLSSDIEQIINYKERVKRDGETLYLKTETGAYLSLSDTPACDPLSWCTYEFVDYFDDPGFYIISVSTHEGWNYIMISAKDGSEFYVHALPILSPNKGHLVAVAIDDAGWGAHGVYIWRIEDNRLISELDYEPSSGDGSAIYFYFKQWKDNRTIELYKQFRPSKKLCPNADIAETEVSLRLEGGGWRFHENLTSEQITCNPKSR